MHRARLDAVKASLEEHRAMAARIADAHEDGRPLDLTGDQWWAKYARNLLDHIDETDQHLAEHEQLVAEDGEAKGAVMLALLEIGEATTRELRNAILARRGGEAETP